MYTKEPLLVVSRVEKDDDTIVLERHNIISSPLNKPSPFPLSQRLQVTSVSSFLSHTSIEFLRYLMECQEGTRHRLQLPTEFVEVSLSWWCVSLGSPYFKTQWRSPLLLWVDTTTEFLFLYFTRSIFFLVFIVCIDKVSFFLLDDTVYIHKFINLNKRKKCEKNWDIKTHLIRLLLKILNIRCIISSTLTLHFLLICMGSLGPVPQPMLLLMSTNFQIYSPLLCILPILRFCYLTLPIKSKRNRRGNK